MCLAYVEYVVALRASDMLAKLFYRVTKKGVKNRALHASKLHVGK